MRLRLPIAASLLFIVGASAMAQAPSAPTLPFRARLLKSLNAQTATSIDPQATDAEQPPTTPLTNGEPNESSEEKLQDKRRQLRVQRLLKQTFDRRPSTILQLWSEPVEASDSSQDTSNKKAISETESLTDEQFLQQLDAQADALSRHVTLGRWSAVEEYLHNLPIEDGNAIYRHILGTLAKPPNRSAQSGVPNQGNIDPRLVEMHVLDIPDILALASIAPAGHDDASIALLANILRQSVSRGQDVDHFVAQLHDAQAQAQSDNPMLGLWPARLLTAANFAIPAGQFLPNLDAAAEDPHALNLLAIHFLARYAQDERLVDLENAWQATQNILAIEHVDDEQRLMALTRAIELVPKIRTELGQQWLADGFTKAPERGRQILASIGALASSGAMTNANNHPRRRSFLEFQKTVAETLLQFAPELADDWREQLTLLATNWLREAEFSYSRDTSRNTGPQMQRDMYGNVFWTNANDAQSATINTASRQGGSPIPADDILELKPNEPWLERIDSSLLPAFQRILALLYLKMDDEEQSFPYIQRLAKSHPDIARSLVKEHLRVWTENHDPNASRRRQSSYIFFFGFEQRANAIPLTRSKQQRNLEDLARLVQQLRSLGLGEIDEQALARAFTTCHSQAEVYRIEAIEAVFGPLQDLKPSTVAALCQQMRQNLSGLWRAPATQQASKTNRKQKDIEAEVRRGYNVALQVIEKAQQKAPDDWRLQLARAALRHDFVDYRQSLEKSTDFAPDRREALMQFQHAADLYAKDALERSESERTTEPFDLWFYASLGAVDLAQINEERRPDKSQFPRIRKAILELPGESAEWHMASFANALFTRMSAAKPAVKVRYLDAGFEIVGDHDRAAEAKKVFDYYNDLVTEIQLVTRIDGEDTVGSRKPFGLFIDIRHTREIERESGGFAKYLQNQNSSRGFAWNYGRPLEDYRDKFQNSLNQALAEQFEILSITFNREDVHSKATTQYGWRVTPYAYVLLKARGPQVDRIPPVQMDLDFLDTSGYVIIPIASAPVPVDAASTAEQPRPATNLKLTQTLDERQADDGKLILEVKATAYGLVPEIESLVDLNTPGFLVESIDDQGVSVVEFASDVDETTIASERIWLVTWKAAPSLDGPAATFRFPSPKQELAEMLYQRYEDADLIPVEETVTLQAQYRPTSYAWLWTTLAVAALAIALLSLILIWFNRRRPVPAQTFQVPEHVTPFSVLALLRTIETENGIREPARTEIRDTINRIERYYFAQPQGPSPDLKEIAQSWVNRSSHDRR